VPLFSRLRQLFRPKPRVVAADAPLRFDYAPRRDGKPDPGEVVWAWVPYEENDGRGKDRPVLIVSRGPGELLGLMLTSKDHDRDAADEARWGRYWMDVGTGAWDPKRRPSEVRLDRILRLPPSAVRREGAALDRTIFVRVAQAAQQIQHKR
jgi:hypothetical protein